MHILSPCRPFLEEQKLSYLDEFVWALGPIFCPFTVYFKLRKLFTMLKRILNVLVKIPHIRREGKYEFNLAKLFEK